MTNATSGTMYSTILSKLAEVRALKSKRAAGDHSKVGSHFNSTHPVHVQSCFRWGQDGGLTC